MKPTTIEASPIITLPAGRLIWLTDEPGSVTTGGVAKDGTPLMTGFARDAVSLTDAAGKVITGPFDLAALSVLATRIADANPRALTDTLAIQAVAAGFLAVMHSVETAKAEAKERKQVQVEGLLEEAIGFAPLSPDSEQHQPPTRVHCLGFVVAEVMWRGESAAVVDRSFPVGTPITTAHPAPLPGDQLARRYQQVGQLASTALGLQELALDPGIDFPHVLTSALEELMARPVSSPQTIETASPSAGRNIGEGRTNG